MLKAVLTLCLSLFLISICSAQEKVVFKANTEFPAQLENVVSSEKSNVGDDVNFVLTEDVVGEGDTIVKGSMILGRIVKIEKRTSQNDIARVCIMFDFLKKGSDFVELIAAITAIEPNTEAIKFATSPTFTSGTTLSLKGKEIELDKGKIFRVKLTKDITSN